MTKSLPPLPETEQPLAFENASQEKCFDHLCQRFPRLLNRENTPKPMATSFKDNLERAQKANPLPPDLTTALKKTIKGYVKSDGYLRAIMKGGPRYNTEGEEEGVISEEHQMAAYKLWQKRYDPNYTPPPPPEKKQKAKAPEPESKSQKTPPKASPSKHVKAQPAVKPKSQRASNPPKSAPQQSAKKSPPRYSGYILTYKADRGFGFVARDDHPQSIFFHRRGFKQRVEDHQLVAGRRVSFEIKPGKKGPNSIEASRLQLEVGHTWS